VLNFVILGPPCFLLCVAVMCFLQTYRWSSRFIHTVATVLDKYTRPARLLVSFLPAGTGSQRSLLPGESSAAQDEVRVELKVPPEIWIEKTAGQTVMIMYPPGQPDLAQLPKSLIKLGVGFLVAAILSLVLVVSLVRSAFS
jgi:hypothetical protein